MRTPPAERRRCGREPGAHGAPPRRIMPPGLNGELVRTLVELAPVGRALDLMVVRLERDVAAVQLGEAGEGLARGAGGTISVAVALAESAALAAAWSTAELHAIAQGATAALDLTTLSGAPPARAEASVVERSGGVARCEVDVRDRDGDLVATARVAYRFDGAPVGTDPAG